MEDRKWKVLSAVVNEYITTGEPVGSKIIAQLPQINVSAATVRNDMALLEELGYLEQPHTSAGRIPTYAGYRLYIDKLMKPEPLSEEECRRLDAMLDTSIPTEEALLQSATKALAELTHCAAVVSNVAPKYSVISKVEVIPTGRRLYVLLLITSSGSIKNKVCRLEFDLTDEQLEFFTGYIEQNLQGIQLDEVSEEMMQQLVLAMGTYMMTLTPLLQAICDMSQDLKKQEVLVSGEGNLLSRRDLDHAQVVQFLEHKDAVKQLLDDSFSGIQVCFGKENSEFVIENSSMIVSKVQKGNQTAGSLGVIGPMRLDYSKVIPYIEYFTKKISDVISQEEDSMQVEPPPGEKG